MKTQIIQSIVLAAKTHPEIIKHLRGRALKIVMIDPDAAHYTKSLERDPREPGLRRKQKQERKIKSLFQRVFDRQADSVRFQLSGYFPMKAAPKIDVNWTDDEKGELVNLYIETVQDGIALYDEESTVEGADYTFANIEAAKFAKKYSFDLIKGIDDTTREALRAAIDTFINVPGATIGDVMASLPFDERRALRVAVTEVTRAYGNAAQIAAGELQKQFPDIKFYKMWHTNVDEKVCPLCQDIENNNPTIELDQDWDGVMNPPRHVGCRCWMTTFTEFAK